MTSAAATTVKLRKGTERYNVDLNGEYIGWVLKSGAQWSAYITSRYQDPSRRISHGERTRTEAVETLVWYWQRTL